MRRFFEPHTLRALAWSALTVTLGLQCLRVFFPLLTWYLADARGAGPFQMAGLAVSAFLPAFLAAGVRRILGPRPALLFSVGGLALLRLAEQVSNLPALDLGLSVCGAALFVLFLPLWFGHEFHAGEAGAVRLAAGLLLGLALDSAIKGAAATLDLSWLPGPLPVAVLGLMSVAAVVLAAREPGPASDAPADPRTVRVLPLLALGPFLMLQCLVYQNQGWIAAVAASPAHLALAWVMAGNLAAAVGMALGFVTGFRGRAAIAPAAALYLSLAAAGAGRPAPSFAAVVILSQLLHGWGWGLLFTAACVPEQRGLRRTTAVVGTGLLLFLSLTFLYYGSLQIAIPIPRAVILPVAGALVGLGIVAAAPLAPVRVTSHRRAWPAAALCLLLGLITLALDSSPQPSHRPPAGFPLRVLTYNIHSAFDVAGHQDPEAIARVIEASGADLIALQEVSRGWLVDGSTDLPAWLSRRLNMPFLFHGTADPVWGNAILSRVPVLASGWAGLPGSGTLVPRGYLWAETEVGRREPLLVLVTHLHHIEEQHIPRRAQVTALLSFWGSRPNSLLLGDLNALPEYAEIGLIAEAGWVDAWSEAGQGPGLTWPSVEPIERIDWIWHTADLSATDVAVIESHASDHLAVLATIDLVP